MTKLKITNDENFQRSAAAPVGMVAVVSMNTIWKRKVEATAGVNMESGSMKPEVPKSPKGLPKSVIVNSLVAFSISSLPNVLIGPMPPICRPNPTK
jgi:hypothetical protein